MISFLKMVVYEPLYNILILILNIPYFDAGLAAIVLTILVKIFLFPISKKMVVTQIKMKETNKELQEIKEKYKDKETQALKTMEFYKKHKINPFSGILSILIQIPIVYSLYHMFLYSGLPKVDPELLYGFINSPEISMQFLGFWDVSQKSLVLALLAAVSTFYQMHFSSKEEKSPLVNNKQDLSKIMARQMKYTFPFIVFFISWQISGVVALYWFVSNLAGIAQDALIRKQLASPQP